jgi:tetratricopeptide (TPR) repeat protein
MKRSALAVVESTVSRRASGLPAGLGLVVAGLAIAALPLAGCATLGNPAASDNDAPLYATSQSNLTSLSEVVEKHPEDPQAYNMRGSVYGEAGRYEQALADFSKAISLDPNYAQAYANRALI